MGLWGSGDAVVLYGPNLVPPEPWLKQALFHVDRVATMVSSLQEPPANLRRLKDEYDAWEPAVLDTLDKPILEKLSTEAIRVAERFPDASEKDRLKVRDRVLAGKFPNAIESYLESNGLLSRLDGDPGRFGTWSARLVPTTLALCGRTLAEKNNWRLTVNSKENLEELLAPLGEDAELGATFTIEALPEVKPEVPLKTVLDFRQRHGSEFAAYRHELSRLENGSLDGSVDPEEAVKNLRLASAELMKAATYAEVPLRKQARTWAVQAVKSPEATATTVAGTAGVIAAMLSVDSTPGKVAVVGLAAGFSAQLIKLRREHMAVSYLRKALAAQLV